MLLQVRQAVPADIPALQDLIARPFLASRRRITRPEQLELALDRVFGVDTQLIEDGTYFVAEALGDDDRVIAGCGGWSKRKTLFGSDHCAGREDALLDPLRDAAKIRAFFVHPGWAPRGVGSRYSRFGGCRGRRRLSPPGDGGHAYWRAALPRPRLRGTGTPAGPARSRLVSPHCSHGKASITVTLACPFFLSEPWRFLLATFNGLRKNELRIKIAPKGLTRLTSHRPLGKRIAAGSEISMCNE